MIDIVIWLLSIYLGGKLYDLGGLEGYNTKARDFGVPLVGLVMLWILGLRMPWFFWLFQFGLMFLSMISYYKKTTTATLWNWIQVGIGFGLCCNLIVIINGNWLWYFLRTIILAVGVGLWSDNIDDVHLEQGGRGGMFIATLPLLLI